MKHCRILENAIIAFPNNKTIRKVFYKGEEAVAQMYVDALHPNSGLRREQTQKEALRYFESKNRNERRNVRLIIEADKVAFQYRRMMFGKIDTKTFSAIRHGVEKSFSLAMEYSNRA